MDIEQTLQSLLHSGRNFPREELLRLSQNQEEAAPLLLKAMEDLLANYKEQLTAEQPIDFGYALMLLGQFRETRLFPILIDLLSLPAADCEALFGDAITVNVGRVLASVYDGNIEALQKLIENESADEYARGQALIAMTGLALEGRILRDTVIAFYKRLLSDRRSETSFYVNTEVAQCSNALYPEEVYEELRELLTSQFVESIFFSLEDVDATLKRSKESVLAVNKNDVRYRMITDVVASSAEWYEMKYGTTPSIRHKHNPAVRVVKVGRNDPCPCGSGKKYKKCHGANAS